MVNQYDAELYKQVIEDAVDFSWSPEGCVDLFQTKTQPVADNVNSPSHYTKGKVEAIDVIEDAIRHAPDPGGGHAAGPGALKYVLRLLAQGQRRAGPAEE